MFVCVATYPEKRSRARARVGHPHSANLVTFAMLTLLVSAVGCTRIFRVPATLGVFLLIRVFSSDPNCGVADVAGSVI